VVWIAAVFIVLTGVAVFVRRRPLAEAEALVLGGSILPGCVIAQAILLLLIAAGLVFAHLRDLI
jgi:hypothetical protein